MDAIPFWGNTGVLGQSDSMVHITPYSIYSGESRGGGPGAWAPPPRNAQGVVNSSFFPKFIKKCHMMLNFLSFYLTFFKIW